MMMMMMSSHVDLLEGDLAKEIENGRLFRLQSYINMVCNVPVGSVSIGWNDTAERHIIRLFRDYLDHPVCSRMFHVILGRFTRKAHLGSRACS